MKYTIEHIVHDGQERDIVFDFGKEHSLVGLFLSCECDLLDSYLEHIDLVLSDKFEKAEVTGNISLVEIGKDNTKIKYLYPDDDDENEVNEEIVSTVELKQLIEEFIVKRKDFFGQKKLGNEV